MRALLTILIGLFWSGLTPAWAQQSGSEVGDQYFKGYLAFTQAERLEQSGDAQGAHQKLQEAQQLISGVARNYPSWQPEVVSYRLKMIEQSLQRLGAKVTPAGGAPPAAAPVPAPAASGPVPGASAAAPSGSMTPVDLLNSQFQGLQKQNADLQRQINDLLTQRKIYEDGYTNSIREKKKVEEDRDLLAKQKAELDARITQVAKDSTASMAELAKLRNEAKMVKEMITLRDQQLSEKDRTIATLQGQNTTLTARQKQLETELQALKQDMGKPDDVKKLVAENARLKGELESARQQVDALKASGEKKDAEIASLRTQITTIQGDLAKLRQENTAYQAQVADLTVKLKDVNAQIERSAAGKGRADAKLVQENRMLHDIIMRELRHRERQRQAKELVIAEMKKMENASQSLMDNLEELTSARIKVTMEEESLFTEPELKQLVAGAGVGATLMAASGKSRETASKPAGSPTATKVPAPEQKLMTDAAKAAESGDLKSAEELYQDALRANPKNTTALLSLAVIKQQQRKFDDATVLLQKCLVYEPDNDQALYRLGVAYFQKNKIEDAQSSFEKSVARNNDNARAHHYLGIIAGKLGNRHRAESEFKQSLAIDPQYGDAHFNLSVLYATSVPPDWTLARKHYQLALDRGVKPDAALEKLLKKSETGAAPAEPAKEKSTAKAQ